MGIKAVFFDLGDTLWHFPKMPPIEVVRGETMKRVGALVTSWGYDMREGDRRMLGRDIRFAVEEETSRAFHGDCVDPGYPELCRRVAARHGMDLTAEQGAALWEAWNLGGLFLGRVLFPDVLETLAWLRDRGFRLASITNRGYSGPRFHEEMSELGLSELFEHVAVSCDVGYMKPHPRLFQYALEQVGVAAEAAVMVGDSLRADVEGAKTLGMVAVWRRPPAGEPLEPATDAPEAGPITPDYVIDEIGELKSLPIFQPGATGAK
jgi:HAD superfamily hydrolase (TIGR01549 family)